MMSDDVRIMGYGQFPIASEYLTALVNVASAAGVDPSDALDGSGLTPQVFFKSTNSVGNISLRVVTANLLARIPLEELVCRFLSQVGAFNHGPLSIAVQSSANLKEALTIIARFADTRTAGKVLGFRENPTEYRLELMEFAGAVEENALVDKFIVLSTLLSIVRNLTLLLKPGGQRCHLNFDFTLRNPDAIQHQFSVFDMAFEQPVNAAIFARDLIWIPAIHDRSVNRDAVRECEAQRLLVSRDTEIEMRVKLELAKSAGPDLNIESVADRLCMCPRSLQRKLTSAGTRFREIKADELHRRAVYYLEHTSLSIESIARELGYAHPSNFIKRFKARSNLSPSEYRESQVRSP